MRKALAIGFFVLLLIMPVFAQGPVNLLTNPGFEGAYNPQDNQGEIRVANGWRAFWSEGQRYVPGIDGGFNDHPTRRPEYNAALPGVDPYRIRSGQAAQHWFSFSGTSYAGVMQRVEGVQVGNTYQARAWLQGWCDNADGNTHYCAPNVAYVSIGIDPDGGDWYGSRAIQWSQWQALTGGYLRYNSPPVVANGTRVTVYISVAFKWPLKHDDAYLDDAELVVLTSSPQPTPTPTPPPPTGDCLDAVQTETIFRRVLIDVLTRIGITISGG